MARPIDRNPMTSGHEKDPLPTTWVGILPTLVMLLLHGDHEGQGKARTELAKMAKAADLWNAAYFPNDKEPDQ